MRHSALPALAVVLALATQSAAGKEPAPATGSDPLIALLGRQLHKPPPPPPPPEHKVFREEHTRIIERWLADHPGRLLLTDLPANVAARIEPGRRLPPGLAKKSLPSDLQRQLGVQGYRPVIIGRDIVLVDPKTSLVVDQLSKVLH